MIPGASVWVLRKERKGVGLGLGGRRWGREEGGWGRPVM